MILKQIKKQILKPKTKVISDTFSLPFCFLAHLSLINNQQLKTNFYEISL